MKTFGVVILATSLSGCGAVGSIAVEATGIALGNVIGQQAECTLELPKPDSCRPARWWEFWRDPL